MFINTSQTAWGKHQSRSKGKNKPKGVCGGNNSLSSSENSIYCLL